MGKLRHLFSILFLTTILTLCATAQSNLTQIRDTIYNADGTPFNGTVVITWVGFSTPTSGTVSPLSTSARIYNGALSVLLVPSTTAAAGSYYQVVYYSSDGTTTWTETWSVPPSTNALSVSGVRTSTTLGSGSTSGSSGSGSSGSGSGSGSGQYATLPIAISQVTGLSSSLNTLSSSLTALTTTVTTNGTTLNTLGTTVSNLGNTVTTNSNTLSALGTTVTNLGGTVNTNSGTLSALGTTVSNLSATVTANGNTLSNLSNIAAGLSTNVVGLTSTVNGLTTTVANNASNLSSLNSTVSALSSSVTNLTSTVGQLQSGGGNINMAFVDGETPSGTLNGSNAVFTLSQTPIAGSLELYRNGLVQTNTIDYTISGSAITFLAGNIPVATDLIQAYYRVTGTSTAPVFADAEVPAGTISGTNLTFTLAYTPNPATSLRLYKNGLLLTQHGDYTIAGNTITFVSAVAPQTGDMLSAFYRH